MQIDVKIHISLSSLLTHSFTLSGKNFFFSKKELIYTFVLKALSLKVKSFNSNPISKKKKKKKNCFDVTKLKYLSVFIQIKIN